MGDRTLRYAYYNPKSKAYLGSVREVYRYAKKLRPKEVTYEKTRAWLNRQRVYTLHKPRRQKFRRALTVPLGLDTDFQADLVDMQKIKKKNFGYAYVLTVVDVLSKFGWAVPLKDKGADEVIRGFKQVLRSGRKPWRLYTDEGKEFVNKKFREFLDSHEIKHMVALNKETKAAVAERFNRTLKDKLWKYFTQSQKLTYLKPLRAIVRNYNYTARHRSIGMPPAEVTWRNEREVWEKQYGATRHVVPKPPAFAEGDRVRLSRAKGIFEKGYEPNFTEEVFEVCGVIRERPPRYVIRDESGEEIEGRFYEDELVKATGGKKL